MSEPQNKPTGAQQMVDELVDLEVADRQKRRVGQIRARPPMSRERRALIALVVAAPILLAILAITFAGDALRSLFESNPPAAVASQEAHKALDALVGEIEAFRKDYQELPESLVEIGVPPRGRWSYAVIGKTHYRVQGTLYGEAVGFDSTTVGKPR
jgi:hypothetical protein